MCQSTSSHHERFDGSGYPRGSWAARFPYSRIVAVADAWMPPTPSASRGAEPEEAVGAAGTGGEPVRSAGCEVFLAQVYPTGRGEAAMSMEWRMLMKTIEIRTSCRLNSFYFTLWLKWLGRAASTAESA